MNPANRAQASNQVFSTGQVADFCRVDPRTVLRWIKRGQLKAFQLPGRGDHRVESRDLMAFLQANNLPTPIGLQLRKPSVVVLAPATRDSQPPKKLAERLGGEVHVAQSWVEAGAMIERESARLLIVVCGDRGNGLAGGIQDGLGFLATRDVYTFFIGTRRIPVPPVPQDQGCWLGLDELKTVMGAKLHGSGRPVAAS